MSAEAAAGASGWRERCSTRRNQTTARIPYTRVKPASDAITSGAVSPGEMPSATLEMPKAIHGCRAVSVKIQPKVLAAAGSTGISGSHRVSQCGAGAPRRVRHR